MNSRSDFENLVSGKEKGTLFTIHFNAKHPAVEILNQHHLCTISIADRFSYEARFLNILFLFGYSDFIFRGQFQKNEGMHDNIPLGDWSRLHPDVNYPNAVERSSSDVAQDHLPSVGNEIGQSVTVLRGYLFRSPWVICERNSRTQHNQQQRRESISFHSVPS